MSRSLNDVAENVRRRRNARSLQGRTLFNTAGDIDQSSLGYDIAITTLTYIKKQITEQRFYEIVPADYVPIAVGDGGFSQAILTNLVVTASGDFEAGNVNQATANDRLATSDVGVASKTMAVINWAKAIGYSVFEIEQALQANNWDIIESKHRARKKDWDLGVQKIAFLGSLSNATNVPGLLTQSSVNSDTATIALTISSMSSASFASFVQNVVASYQNNCVYTAMPTHFLIPQDDYVGLATPVSATYPFISKLQYLKDAFAQIVPNGIKVQPLVYGIPNYNKNYVNGGTGLHRYVMYRYDAETLRMDIPVDYTVTAANTLNNFQFQDAGYGQYTGVGVYRPLEVLYFDAT